MHPPIPVRIGCLAAALFCAMLARGGTSWAASFPEFLDPHPAAGNQFGAIVVPLATGNVVVTSPGDDFQASNAGAVYLFNGSTGALISTFRGAKADDAVGGTSVTALANGNFVVVCEFCDAGSFVDAGVVTWGNGTTGVSGVVSSVNSLQGSTANDRVGLGGVTALTNGNYVVQSPSWDNGAIGAAGAVTWADGTTGRVGAISAANSLVGSTASDQVGSGGVTALTNGNYVVASPFWNNGALVDAGAVTWGNGMTGRVGGIAAVNSLVGSATGDQVGGDGVTALANGHYVAVSHLWNNGGVADAGAVTWADGTVGRSGVLSASNSLVGSTVGDNIGSGGATALTNGNYVIASPLWNNGAVADVGAVTWGLGIAGAFGVVSAANSLVGSTASDQVGSRGATALSNGHYVVASPLWNNGAVADAGAVTWGDGTISTGGVVSAANSVVGSTANDNVAGSDVTALANGNYVVRSPDWNNGAITDAGAATWGNGTTGETGAVSAANSLVGSTALDGVSGSGVTALANGNYVVRSPNWDDGAIVGAGAATWGDGTTGVSGVITGANSLVGSTTQDRVGFAGVTALANGNYVVQTHNWNNGPAVDVGAVTWCDGTTGRSGVITAANSLVGSVLDDEVGLQGVTALADGNYVVTSSTWNHGALVDAGAATWADGTTGVTGTISADNSIVARVPNTGLVVAIEDAVNGNFISRFLTEGGGRIRVGPVVPFVIASAVDIPNDQGGWLRLTFLRYFLDHLNGSPPVSTYGVWRHVPGTFPSFGGGAAPGAAHVAAPDPAAIERMRSSLPVEMDAHVANGRLFGTMFATTSGSRPAETAAALPPGTWELVTNVPAIQQDQYVVAVPTITNAAADDFVVTAHTTTPSIWFVTAPVSGQSVDNLAPGQPTQFTANYTNGQTDLDWAANPEPDIGSYSLHRGVSASFTPTIGNRIATPIGTDYSDVGPAGGYYKLSAVDVNGNQSTFALITPGMTTDANDGEPVAFAFQGARPNPATPLGLRVAFALPSGDPARLELLDVSGRLVIARDVGSLGAGRHVVNLAERRSVPAGIYWVRLTQGRNRGMTRVAVIE